MNNQMIEKERKFVIRMQDISMSMFFLGLMLIPVSALVQLNCKNQIINFLMETPALIVSLLMVVIGFVFLVFGVIIGSYVEELELSYKDIDFVQKGLIRLGSLLEMTEDDMLLDIKKHTSWRGVDIVVDQIDTALVRQRVDEEIKKLEEIEKLLNIKHPTKPWIYDFCATLFFHKTVSL